MKKKEASALCLCHWTGWSGSFLKTHYSTLVEVKMNYTLHKELVESKPIRDVTKAHNEKYYHFRVLDPRVNKVVIQATTIHGDPELFVSRKDEKPGPMAFERRGVASGIFPENRHVHAHGLERRDPRRRLLRDGGLE